MNSWWKVAVLNCFITAPPEVTELSVCHLPSTVIMLTQHKTDEDDGNCVSQKAQRSRSLAYYTVLIRTPPTSVNLHFSVTALCITLTFSPHLSFSFSIFIPHSIAFCIALCCNWLKCGEYYYNPGCSTYRPFRLGDEHLDFLVNDIQLWVQIYFNLTAMAAICFLFLIVLSKKSKLGPWTNIVQTVMIHLSAKKVLLVFF